MRLMWTASVPLTVMCSWQEGREEEEDEEKQEDEGEKEKEEVRRGLVELECVMKMSKCSVTKTKRKSVHLEPAGESWPSAVSRRNDRLGRNRGAL